VVSLDGASVVVLGASSGMGLATAVAAHAAGADVTIVGRDPTRLEQAVDQIGPGTRSFALDVADADAMLAMFEQLDHVDHVAMLAGEQPYAPVADTEHELFQRALDVRVWGAYSAIKGAAAKMPPHGSFTFTSGFSAHRPRAHRSSGAVATAAVESFARAMAVELGPIRVNVICPGAIDTPLLQRVFGDQRESAMRAVADRLPAGRIGTVEEIADAILFLMRNTYVTGVVLHVDGGAMLV
jgi:NAD(P)-dependent dehydrogenase (short-subunit alcohol dehydrogenase family)